MSLALVARCAPLSGVLAVTAYGTGAVEGQHLVRLEFWRRPHRSGPSHSVTAFRCTHSASASSNLPTMAARSLRFETVMTLSSRLQAHPRLCNALLLTRLPSPDPILGTGPNQNPLENDALIHVQLKYGLGITAGKKVRWGWKSS